jgi:hypothetical protein
MFRNSVEELLCLRRQVVLENSKHSRRGSLGYIVISLSTGLADNGCDSPCLSGSPTLEKSFLGIGILRGK